MKNDKYDSEGMLGSYRTSEDPFPNADGVVTFPGYGADKEDLERGFCRPTLRELPQYDKVNYYDRWTFPRVTDEAPGNHGILPKDIEFRSTKAESKGLFIRPRIPTER